MQDKTEYLVMAHGREESVQKARMSLVTNKRVSTGSNSRSNVPRGKKWRRSTPVASLVTTCAGSPQRVLAPRNVDDARPPISLQGSAHKSRPGLSSRQGPSRGPSSTGLIDKRVAPLMSAGTVRRSGVSSPAFLPRSPTPASSSQFLSRTNHQRAGRFSVSPGRSNTVPPSFARFEATPKPEHPRDRRSSKLQN